MHKGCAISPKLAALGILLAAGLCTGCTLPSNESSAMRISSVDPLTEPEFDAFAGRIAEKLTPLTQGSAGQPAKLGAPQLAVEDEAWRPSARYFSYALMDGLSDRTGGAVHFSRGTNEPVQYRTMLMFSTSKTRSDRRTVDFVVLDANGSREILRESAESVRTAPPPQVASAQPQASAGKPPEKSASPPPPPQPPQPKEEPRSRPPSPEREVATTKQPRQREPRQQTQREPSASQEPSRRQARSEPPLQEAPPPARGGEPLAEASIAPPRESGASPRVELRRGGSVETPPSDAPPAEARPIEPRSSEKRIKRGEIEIDAKSSEIGAQIISSGAAYSGRTFVGSGGYAILLDNDTVESFAVAGQRTGRSERGQLQTQLTLVCGGDSRDAEYRVVFFDAAGEPVSATPVLSLEFERNERKRITVTAGDSRASRYVWLVKED